MGPADPGVVPVGPEQVVDPAPLWGEGYGATRGVPERQRFARPERSRWKKGVTTFGPGIKVALTALYATYLVWGLFHQFVISYIVFACVGAYLMFHVWRKDEVDDSKAPLRGSIRETREAISSEWSARRNPSAVPQGSEPARYVCGQCGRPAVPGRAVCTCGAPASMIVATETPTPPVMEVRPPRPLPARRSAGAKAGLVARVVITVALVAGLAVFWITPDKIAVAAFPAYVAVAGLMVWGMWRGKNRW